MKFCFGYKFAKIPMTTEHQPSEWRHLSVHECLRKVEYKRPPSIPLEKYQQKGRFPVIDQGSSEIAGWTDSEEAVIRTDLPVIVFGDHTCVFKYVHFAFATGADGTKLLRVDDEILDPLFLYYALQGMEIPNKGYNRHFKYLRGLSLAFPPNRAEQRAIARALDAVQKAKEARQCELALERERKAALMEHLFTHGTSSEPTKQTEIGEIPDNWRLAPLSELGEIVTGTTPRTDVEEYYGGPFMFAAPGDVGESPYIQDTAKHLSEEGLKVSRELPKNTVLTVCIGATIGKVAMTVADRSATNQQINALIPNKLIVPEFLYYALLFRARELPSLASRTAVPIINKSVFSGFQVPVTEIDEQARIANALGACDRKTDALVVGTAILDELFRAMLEELMTGRLSASPLNEEHQPQ
jgi:type I restriction enzyme S subunit